MAFTIVQKSAGFATASASTVAKAFASNNTAGNLLVAFCSEFNVATITISDTQGNVWVGPIHAGGVASTSRADLFYCLSCKAGANTVTIANAGTSCALALTEYSSPTGATAFDSSNTTFSNGNAAPGVNVTTAIANELVVGMVAMTGGLTLTPLANNTIEIGAPSSAQAFDGNAASAGAFASGSSTNTGATVWSYAGAAFQAATFSISGNAGTAGATVSWSGTSSGSTTADGSGNYTISGLANGNYTITPSLTGFTFAPTSSNQTVSGANITGVNFTATAVSSGAYSVPDCRVAPFGPNTSRTVQGTKIFDVQTSDNATVPGVDSRAAGAPVDCRVASIIPQNSRTPGIFGPGE